MIYLPALRAVSEIALIISRPVETIKSLQNDREKRGLMIVIGRERIGHVSNNRGGKRKISSTEDRGILGARHAVISNGLPLSLIHI